MKPILCDTCLLGKKEIVTFKIDKRYYFSIQKTTTKVQWYCEKKGRYAKHHERYNCSDYANTTLESFKNVK